MEDWNLEDKPTKVELDILQIFLIYLSWKKFNIFSLQTIHHKLAGTDIQPLIVLHYFVIFSDV